MGLPEASSTLPEIDADTCPQAGAAMRAADQRRGVYNNRLRCAAFTALFSLSSSGQGHGRGVPGIFVLRPQPAMISVTFEPPPQKAALSVWRNKLRRQCLFCTRRKLEGHRSILARSGLFGPGPRVRSDARVAASPVS